MSEAFPSRTRILRLKIENYRSIRSLELKDFPPIVVLHGPNGSGKSNILRAISIALKAAVHASEWRRNADSDSPPTFPFEKAEQLTGVRPDDFRWGTNDLLKIELDIELSASRARLFSERFPPKSMRIRLEAGRSQRNELSVRLGFELDDFNVLTSKSQRLNDIFAVLNGEIPPTLSPRLTELTLLSKEQLGTELRTESDRTNTLSNQSQPQTEALHKRIDAYRFLARETQPSTEGASGVPRELVEFAEHLTLQKRLLDYSIDSNKTLRQVPKRIAEALAQCGVFREMGEKFDLVPTKNSTLDETQTLVEFADGRSIPLKNLGSGEEQLVVLIEQMFSSGAPIVQIEEPEAHLHKELALGLATYLASVTEFRDKHPPLIDQLFLATHHPAFAIAPTYLDVQRVNGETIAEWKDRKLSSVHFFEPGPILRALEAMVEDGLPEDRVIYHNGDRAIRARELQESIKHNTPLAKEFVAVMTEHFVRSLRKRTEPT